MPGRLASRVDANQVAIVKGLRQIGARVLHLHTLGHGAPDLLVQWKGVLYFMEIKTATGTLTPDEVTFHRQWHPVAIVRSLVEALAVLGLLLLLAVVPAAGQDAATRDALRWRDHAGVADTVSTWTVVGAVAAPCLLDRQWRCVKREAVHVGLAVGLAELVKLAVQRTRPDGSDRKSFYSMHTSITCAAVLQTKVWALCPAVGYLRVAADKHWLSDVATGAGVGALVSVAW